MADLGGEVEPPTPGEEPAVKQLHIEERGMRTVWRVAEALSGVAQPDGYRLWVAHAEHHDGKWPAAILAIPA